MYRLGWTAETRIERGSAAEHLCGCAARPPAGAPPLCRWPPSRMPPRAAKETAETRMDRGDSDRLQRLGSTAETRIDRGESDRPRGPRECPSAGRGGRKGGRGGAVAPFAREGMHPGSQAGRVSACRGGHAPGPPPPSLFPRAPPRACSLCPCASGRSPRPPSPPAPPSRTPHKTSEPLSQVASKARKTVHCDALHRIRRRVQGTWRIRKPRDKRMCAGGKLRIRGTESCVGARQGSLKERAACSLTK